MRLPNQVRAVDRHQYALFPKFSASEIIPAGSCSITCGNATSSNDCPVGETCSCYCDGRNEPQCGSCS